MFILITYVMQRTHNKGKQM